MEIRQTKVMKRLCVLLVLILVHFMKTFVLSTILEYTYNRKVAFDGEHLTSATSSIKSESVIDCALYCNQITACVAFVFNGGAHICHSLDRILSTGNLTSGNGSWLYYEKLANQPDQSTIECPVAWEQEAGSEYCFVNNQTDWNTAKDTCTSMGAHLVALETTGEDSWIYGRFLDHYSNGVRTDWWSGGTDIASEGTFYWHHSQDPLTFTKWSSGDPSGGTVENCVLLLVHYDWQDFPCSEKYNFVCEK